MKTDKHAIFVCTSCRHKDSPCRPGLNLIRKLQDALALAVPMTGDDFEVSGVACMAGCSRPCTVAFRASEKASYLFGDIDPDTDIDDLVTFARDYRRRVDGWCSASERPGKLRRTALARIPAAMIIAETDPMEAS